MQNTQDDVVLNYAKGFPTRIPQRHRLAAMLRELGQPTKIQRIGTQFHLEWQPIFPGVPDPVYTLPDPWRDGRTVVSIELAK